jgi:hypothetical protein
MLKSLDLLTVTLRCIIVCFAFLLLPSQAQASFGGRVMNIPGTIQAEDYNDGGEGVGYYDTTPGSQLGLYRKDDVDIGPVNADGTGGYVVGAIIAGEWLKYDINVASSISYDFQLRLATGAYSNQTLCVEIDGANLTGPIYVPDTKAWGAYQTVSVPNIRLSAGMHSMRVVMNGNNFNLDWIAIVPSGSSTSSPAPPATAPTYPQPEVPNPIVSGGFLTVPGLIEAENYNTGGEGVGYHDTTPGNQDGSYRKDDVDIKPSPDSGGGFVVAHIAAGEWLKYNINVAASGAYVFLVRTGTDQNGRALHIEIDGANVSGTVVLPNTGNYATFQTMAVPNISLKSGPHAMRVYMETDQFDLNWIKIQQQ